MTHGRPERTQELARAHAPTPPTPRSPLLNLQAAAGNQAVSRLVDPTTDPAPAGPTATTHPTVKRGSKGPAVFELQTKLNRTGASPPLDIDGKFGPLTQTAVKTFQGGHTLDPDGIVGPKTWPVLDAEAGKIGPGPIPLPNTKLSDIKGRPQAIAEGSTHPTLKKGDTGPAVRELQEKLNPATPLFPGPPAIPSTGTFDQLTEDEVKKFQGFFGQSPTGVVDAATWATLDLLHPGSSVGRVEKDWHERVEGNRYGMKSQYTWEIKASEVHVTVKLAFTGDATTTPNLATHIAKIQAGITDHWNRFAAQDTVTGDTLPIVFEAQSVASGGDNSVQLSNCVDPTKPETCRSDAGNWFVNPPGQSIEYIAAHEFGHMIGLEDEYRRGHGDYKRVVGDEPTGTVHAAPDTVARELHTALHQGEIPILDDLFADEDARADECERIVTAHAVSKGANGISVADSYQKLFPGVAGQDDSLVQEVMAELPAARQMRFIELFTASSDSLMGQTPKMDSSSSHDHPIEARHVREFIEHVQMFRPAGVWGAVQQR